MAECKKCKAPLLWVDTKTGKKMPLDSRPFSAVQVKEGIGEVIQVYMPHWATCPDAASFRKPKDPTDREIAVADSDGFGR